MAAYETEKVKRALLRGARTMQDQAIVNEGMARLELVEQAAGRARNMGGQFVGEDDLAMDNDEEVSDELDVPDEGSFEIEDLMIAAIDDGETEDEDVLIETEDEAEMTEEMTQEVFYPAEEAAPLAIDGPIFSNPNRGKISANRRRKEQFADEMVA